MTPDQTLSTPQGTPYGHTCAFFHQPQSTLWATHEKVAERSWWHRVTDQGAARHPEPQPGRAHHARKLDHHILTITKRSSATTGTIQARTPQGDVLWTLDQEHLWQHGAFALTRDPGGGLQRWNLSGPQPQHLGRQPDHDLGHHQRFDTLAPPPRIHREGTHALFLRSSGSLYLLDLQNESVTTPAHNHPSQIVFAVFGPENTLLMQDDNEHLHWTDPDGQALATLIPRDEIALVPELARWSRQNLFIPREDGSCVLWSPTTHEILWTSQPAPQPDEDSVQGPAHLVALTPTQEGAWLSHMNHHIQHLDLKTGAWTQQVSYKEPLTLLQTHPGGLALGDQAGCLHLLS